MVAPAALVGTVEKTGKAAGAGRADTVKKAGKAGTVDMVDRETGVWAVPDRGGMDLASEDLGDPTSNRRRVADMAAGSNSSSRLYYDIRSSMPRAWLSRGHCSRNIHWALAWNRILSLYAVKLTHKRRKNGLAPRPRQLLSCSIVFRFGRKVPGIAEHPAT